MKSFLVLAVVVAVSTAFVFPQQRAAKPDSITDQFKCLLCQDVAKDTEKWAGDEEQSNESKQIAECEKILGGADNIIAKIVCEDFVKTELDDLITHLESPEAEGQDALQACQSVGLCKQ